MRTYQLFGLRVAMDDLALPWPPSPLEEPADWTLRVVRKAPLEPEWHRKHEPAFRSPGRPAGAADSLELYRLPGMDIVRCGGAIDFFVAEDQILAFPDPRAAGSRQLLTLRFLGPVMAYLLERQGLPVLHASAIEKEGKALVFMASNRGGKSSLAAAFMNSGSALLSDDLVALERQAGEIRMRSAFPEMRMWPDQARHFRGVDRALPKVHPRMEKRRVAIGASGFGRFEAMGAPIGAFYLPTRIEAPETAAVEVRCETVGPADALMELLRHSFLPNLVLAAGWQEQRLELLSRLLHQCPVLRLSYPSGLHHLERVCGEISLDLARRGV